jgi:type VI secretion system secreted protein VgrG
VIAATGNSFNGQQGEGFVAIVPTTISVTATDLSGNLLANAQRLGPAIGHDSSTTVAAPGGGLTAPSGDDGSSVVEGTSFAAPLVTGSVVLLQQIYQSRFGSLPSVAQLKSWIQQGSDSIHDSVTGISLAQLDLPKAAALIPSARTYPAPAPAPAPERVAPAPVLSTFTFSAATAAGPVSIPTANTTTTASNPAPAPSSQPTATTTVASTAPSSPPVTTVATTNPTTSPTQVPGNHNGNDSGSNNAGNQPSDAHSVLESLLRAMSVWAASSASQS